MWRIEDSIPICLDLSAPMYWHFLPDWFLLNSNGLVSYLGTRSFCVTCGVVKIHYAIAIYTDAKCAPDGIYQSVRLLVFDLLGLANWTLVFAGPMASESRSLKCHVAVHFKPWGVSLLLWKVNLQRHYTSQNKWWSDYGPRDFSKV